MVSVQTLEIPQFDRKGGTNSKLLTELCASGSKVDPRRLESERYNHKRLRVTTKLQAPGAGKNSGNLHIITSKKKRMRGKRSEIKIKISMEDDPQTSLKKTT